MRRILIFSFLWFVAFAEPSDALTKRDFAKILPGMSVQEVESRLGRPDGFQSSGNQTAYMYTGVFINIWLSWDRADYTVIFTDGIVSAVGHGEPRQSQTTGGLIIVVP